MWSTTFRLPDGPLYRSWHLRWGATPAEVTGELPGDALMPMCPAPDPSDRTAFKVGSFAVNEWLLRSKPASTWVWRLTSAGPGQTRLVTRIRAVYDAQRPLTALFWHDFDGVRRLRHAPENVPRDQDAS